MGKLNMDIFISHDTGCVLCFRGNNLVSFNGFTDEDQLKEEYKYIIGQNKITPGKDMSIYNSGLIYHIIWERKQLGFYNTDAGHTGTIKTSR